MKEKTYQADVIIVGGGLAGIVTALDLMDSGRSILILDRDTRANFGGLAKWAFGGMLFVDTKHQRKQGINDSIDLAKQDWFSVAQFDQDEVWGRKWALQYLNLCTEHGYRWLRAHGINFFPVINWVERGLIRQGNSIPRFHMVWGTGWELVNKLRLDLENHPKASNLQIICDHRVSEILVEQKTIRGVRGTLEHSGDTFSALGTHVVIATGGINGSIELVKKHWYKPWGQPPEVILNGAHQYAVGDLHEATTKINGNVVNLDKQWNYVAGIRHYKPRHEGHGLSIVPGKSQLWLNYEGRRFGPMPLMSPYDTRYLVEQICKEPIKYSWQLLNMKIAKKEFAISGSEHNELMKNKKFLPFIFKTLFIGNGKLVKKIIDRCEDVIIADHIPQLVDKMNALTGEKHVKLKYIEDAVTNYDGQIERGFYNDEQLRRIQYVRQYKGDRMRTCNFQRINDPKAGPLIAIRSYILSRKSLGGIQTNLESQVLSQPDHTGHQEPIEGLYAVGEAAGFGGGGMHGKGSLEGTFLGGCVISGRVAAASILGKTLS